MSENPNTPKDEFDWNRLMPIVSHPKKTWWQRNYWWARPAVIFAVTMTATWAFLTIYNIK